MHLCFFDSLIGTTNPGPDFLCQALLGARDTAELPLGLRHCKIRTPCVA